MFSCKVCKEKEIRIDDFKKQIEQLNMAIATRDAKISELIHTLVEQNKVILNTYTIGTQENEIKEEAPAIAILNEFEVPNEWDDINDKLPPVTEN